MGCCLGWNSPCSELLKQKYDFPTYQRNLIGAALPLGCLLGVIVVPFLVDRIGRKNTMLAAIPPFLIGWILIIFASSHVSLYIVGRFITGFFSGMYCVVTPMYCAEISEKEIRGIFKFYLGSQVLSPPPPPISCNFCGLKFFYWIYLGVIQNQKLVN